MNRSTPTHGSAHWQARAEEARRSAAEATDPDVKSVLLEIAQAYEQLARIVAQSGRA
jgi:hypothetical protein